MIAEKSAGGIILRHIGKLTEILLIRDMNGNWTFPKGLIEPNESAEETAFREIREEVGLRQLKLLKSLGEIHYQYQKASETVSKTVNYFLLEETAAETVICQKEEGISAYFWTIPERALEIIGYPETNRSLIKNVIKFLNLN